MNFSSPAQIRKTLDGLGVGLKKRWGQNYLINRGAREKLVGFVDPVSSDNLWEIGAGLGAITDLMLGVGNLVLFELDRKIVEFLVERYTKKFAHIRIVSGDVLKIWQAELRANGAPDKVVGNLPFNSASAIVASFAEAGFDPSKLVFIVQKELAQRLTGRPGQKNYSALSVVVQCAYRIECKGDLAPGSFYPEPHVTSTIVELVPRQTVAVPSDRSFFSRLVRSLFSSRRKTLQNNLLASFVSEQCNSEDLLRCVRDMGIDPVRRSETLCVSDFVALSNEFMYSIEKQKRRESL